MDRTLTLQLPGPRQLIPCASTRAVVYFSLLSLTPSVCQVLEYMGGGDLLNLLIEKDVFEENFARFYIAEVGQRDRIQLLGSTGSTELRTPDDPRSGILS